jgi:hypothetical protein
MIGLFFIVAAVLIGLWLAAFLIPLAVGLAWLAAPYVLALTGAVWLWTARDAPFAHHLLPIALALAGGAWASLRNGHRT